eukprot:349929-Chlamydomonas_euryale.AAC.19
MAPPQTEFVSAVSNCDGRAAELSGCSCQRAKPVWGVNSPGACSFGSTLRRPAAWRLRAAHPQRHRSHPGDRNTDWGWH